MTQGTYPTRLLFLLLVFCSTVPHIDAQEPPASGTIITIAGTGPSGFSPDGVAAANAVLAGPIGLALDAGGTLFFTDEFNWRVRKIAADGTLATVAGNGSIGFAGERSPAREAALDVPAGPTVDAAGNVYFSDKENKRVRKVDLNGMMTTVAGSGPARNSPNRSSSGDGGLATNARLDVPDGLAVNAEGDLYITEARGNRVRKVDTQGIITTVAGGGTRRPQDADGGPATEARLNTPTWVAVDNDGNLYVAEFGANRVRKIDRQGIITTVAGTGSAGFSGDGGPATQAQLRQVLLVTVDSAGNLFIADWGNYRVRKVDAQGIITTVAGDGTPRYAGDGAIATATGLRGPSGLAVDAAGNLYIADTEAYHDFHDRLNLPNERILKVFGVAAPGLLAGRPFPSP